MKRSKKKAVAIPVPGAPSIGDLPLRFSFRHLDTAHPKFPLSCCHSDFFCCLFITLGKFSKWRVSDFTDQNNDEHRHIIAFAQTTEPDGFQTLQGIDKEQLGFQEGWQFGVHPEVPYNQWRVHGILVDDTFYIIWLDPDHKLYLR